MCHNINNQDLGEELHPCRAEFLLIRRGSRLGGSMSERKLAANRANARLSTGPRTPQGKTRSSSNALKHGLLSGQILLDHEKAEDLEALREGIYEELQPIGPLEQTLVEKIVACAWLQKRALTFEAALMKYECRGARMASSGPVIEGEEPGLGVAAVRMLNGGALDRIQRYETSKERQMYKALHELQRLQAVRQNGMALVPVAIDVDVQGDGPTSQ